MKKELIVNVALPYATYLLLHHYFGVANVPALAAGAVFPIVSIIVTFLRERRLQPIGLIVLVATSASIAGSFLLDSPTLLLAKGSLITGTVGLVFGLSLLWKRPLVYYIATADPDDRREGEALWPTTPRYRQMMRTITIAWTVALIAEALLRLALIPLLPIEIFLPISETMWIALFVPMTAWSWRYGQRTMSEIKPA
ncbi:VC0807 family protein [Amorphus orientalis]|uniref:Intracellular septation protein A n=1 Tax=Amorphus orientalis TaxID=649198 RepID=A0AAE3VPK8_9HYPH|nr:VC0807 family protein [Amorphus orientalis]MDQ0315693.1 hypothetical protein [Amorphus orientalis]